MGTASGEGEFAPEHENGSKPAIVLDGQGRSFGDFAVVAEEAVRASDQAKAAAIRKEQVRFLYDRYAKNHPDILQIPREVQGFYFFELDAELARQGSAVNGKTMDAIAAFEKDPDSDEWIGIIEANKELILGEFRINLRPQKDYVPETVDRLLDLFEKDPGLRGHASSFKVKIGPSAPDPAHPEKAYSEIIIYAKLDTTRDKDGKTGSRKSLETLLPPIAEALRDLESCADTSPINRKVAPVNDLISVSQSGGDLKGLLGHVDAAKGTHYLDEYFDKETNHAFAKGEPRPDIGLEDPE